MKSKNLSKTFESLHFSRAWFEKNIHDVFSGVWILSFNLQSWKVTIFWLESIREFPLSSSSHTGVKHSRSTPRSHIRRIAEVQRGTSARSAVEGLTNAHSAAPAAPCGGRGLSARLELPGTGVAAQARAPQELIGRKTSLSDTRLAATAPRYVAAWESTRRTPPG